MCEKVEKGVGIELGRFARGGERGGEAEVRFIGSDATFHLNGMFQHLLKGLQMHNN